MDIERTYHRLVKRTFVVSGAILLSFSSFGVSADGVNDMCVDSKKICECAARQLNSEVGEKGYALYESIGAVYLANKEAGMNMVEAWDAAVTVESDKLGKNFVDTLSTSNNIGSAHRKAIEACKGS